MKPILLLSTALFLVVAPAPDSSVISEISAGFLSSSHIEPLLAAEPDSPMMNDRKAGKQDIEGPQYQ